MTADWNQKGISIATETLIFIFHSVTMFVHNIRQKCVVRDRFFDECCALLIYLVVGLLFSFFFRSNCVCRLLVLFLIVCILISTTLSCDVSYYSMHSISPLMVWFWMIALTFSILFVDWRKLEKKILIVCVVLECFFLSFWELCINKRDRK